MAAGAACRLCDTVAPLGDGGACFACEYTRAFVAPGSWVEDAWCSQTDPELFFPRHQNNSTQEGWAKEICADCGVRLQCLQYALDNRERHGIWGGLNPKERERLMKGKSA